VVDSGTNLLLLPPNVRDLVVGMIKARPASLREPLPSGSSAFH
jgi:hypothetical protein